MNLEHLFKMIKNNYHKLPNKKRALKIFKYYYEVIEWRKSKLKLGAIVFEIKETFYHGIVILEEIDIRYIRQDNTVADSLKLETRLKAIGWKWDLKNIIAFLVVIFFFCLEFYTYVHHWYCKNLSTLAFRAEHFDYVLRFGFEQTFTPNSIGDLKKWSLAHYWLVDLFTDFCTYFNIIF